MGMISFLKQNKSEAKKVEEAIKVEEQPKVEEIVKAEVVETIVDKPVVEEAIKVEEQPTECEEEVKPRRRRRS